MSADHFEGMAEAIHEELGTAGAWTSKATGAEVTQPCSVCIQLNPVNVDFGGVEVHANGAVLQMRHAGLQGTPRKGDVIVTDTRTFTVGRLLRTTEEEWELLCQA